MNGLKKRVMHSLKIAEYTEKRLIDAGIDAWRNKNAITVVFPQVHADVREKWQLATADGKTHLICMPNVRKDQIDEFLYDINNSR